MNRPTMQGRRLLALLLALLMLATMVPATALADAIEAVVPVAAVESQQDDTQSPAEDMPELSDNAAVKAGQLKAVKLNSTSFKQSGIAKLSLTTKNAVAAFVTVDSKTELPEDLSGAAQINKNKAKLELPIQGLEKGKHQLYVWLQDKNGNWAQYGKKITIKVTQKPAIVEEPVEEPATYAVDADARENSDFEIAPVIMPEVAAAADAESAEVVEGAVSRAPGDSFINSTVITNADGTNSSFYKSGFDSNNTHTLFLDLKGGNSVTGNIYFNMGFNGNEGAGVNVSHIELEKDGGTINVTNVSYNYSTNSPLNPTIYNPTGHKISFEANAVGTIDLTVAAYSSFGVGRIQGTYDTITVHVYDSHATADNFVGIDVDANFGKTSGATPAKNNYYVIDLKGKEEVQSSIEYFIKYKGIFSTTSSLVDAHIIQDNDSSILNKISTVHWRHADSLYNWGQLGNHTSKFEFLWRDYIDVIVKQENLNQTYKFTVQMVIDGEMRDADFTVHVIDSTKSKIGDLTVYADAAEGDSHTIYLTDILPSKNTSTLSYKLNLNFVGNEITDTDQIGASVVSFKDGTDVADIVAKPLVAGNGDIKQGLIMAARPGMAGKSGTYTLSLTVNDEVRTYDFEVRVANLLGDKTEIVMLNFIKATEKYTVIDLAGMQKAGTDIEFEYTLKGNLADVDKIFPTVDSSKNSTNLGLSYELDGFQPLSIGGAGNGRGIIRLDATRDDIGGTFYYDLILTLNNETITLPFIVKVVDTTAGEGLVTLVLDKAEDTVIDLKGATNATQKVEFRYAYSGNYVQLEDAVAEAILRSGNDVVNGVTIMMPEPVLDGNGDQIGNMWFGEGYFYASVTRDDIGTRNVYDLAMTVNKKTLTTRFVVTVLDSTDGEGLITLTLEDASQAAIDLNGQSSATANIEFKYIYSGNFEQLENAVAEAVLYNGKGYNITGVTLQAPTIVTAGTVGNTNNIYMGKGVIAVAVTQDDVDTQTTYNLNMTVNDKTLTIPFTVIVYDSTAGEGLISLVLDQADETIIDLKGATSATQKVEFRYVYSGNHEQLRKAVAEAILKSGKNVVNGVTIEMPEPVLDSNNQQVGNLWFGEGYFYASVTRDDIGTRNVYDLAMTVNDKTLTTEFVITVYDSTDGEGLITLVLDDAADTIIDLKGNTAATQKVEFRYAYNGNYAQLEDAIAEAILKSGKNVVSGVTIMMPAQPPLPNQFDNLWFGEGYFYIGVTRDDIDTQSVYDLSMTVNGKTLTTEFVVIVYDSTNGEGIIALTLEDAGQAAIDLMGQRTVTADIEFKYVYSGNFEQLQSAVADALLKAGKGYNVTGVTLQSPTVVPGGAFGNVNDVYMGKGVISVIVTQDDVDTQSTYDLNMTVNGETLTTPFTVIVYDSTAGEGIVAIDFNHAANDGRIDLAGNLTKDGAINFRYIYTGNFLDVTNFEAVVTQIAPAGDGPSHSVTMGSMYPMSAGTINNAFYGLGTVNMMATREDIGKRFTYELSMRVNGTDEYIKQTFTVVVVDTNDAMITQVNPTPAQANGHYYIFVGDSLNVQYSTPYSEDLVGKQWAVTSTNFASTSVTSATDAAQNPSVLYGDVRITGVAEGTGIHTLSINGKTIDFTVTVYPKLDAKNAWLVPDQTTITTRRDGSEKQQFKIMTEAGLSLAGYDVEWRALAGGKFTISEQSGMTATVTGIAYGIDTLQAILTPKGTTDGVAPATITLTALVTVTDYTDAELVVTDSGNMKAEQLAYMSVRDTITLKKIDDYHFIQAIDGDIIPNVDIEFPGKVTYQYATSDASIATIDSNGIVTARAEGDAIITITGTYLSQYGVTYVKSVDFYVHVGSNSITLNPNQHFDLFPGDIKTIDYEAKSNVSLNADAKLTWRIDRTDGLNEDYYNALNSANIMKWEKGSRQLIISDEAPAGDYTLTIQMLGNGKRVQPIRSSGLGEFVQIYEYDNPITGYDYLVQADDAIIAAAVISFHIKEKPQKVLVDDSLGNAKARNVTPAQLAADYTAAYPKTLTLSYIGKNAQLEAKVLPSKSHLQNVTWYSVDPSIAVVDSKTGIVTSTGAGTTQVYAVTNIEGLKAEDQIKDYIIIKSVGDSNVFTLDPAFSTILVNGKAHIVPYFINYAGNDISKQVEVKYEALNVATGNGTELPGTHYARLTPYYDQKLQKYVLDVTGLRPGEVVIKATIFEGTSEERSAISTVVINEAVTEINSTRKHLTIAVGQAYQYDLLSTLTFNGKQGINTSYLNTDVDITILDPSILMIDEQDYSYIQGLKIGTTMIKVRSKENPKAYCDIYVEVIDIAEFLITDVENIQVYEGTTVPVSITSKLDTVYGDLVWTYQDYSGNAFDGKQPGSNELIAWYDANNQQVVANKAGYVELIATAKLPTDLYNSYHNGLYIGMYMPKEAVLKIRVTVLKKAESVSIDYINDQAFASLRNPKTVVINGTNHYKVEYPVGSRFILQASVMPYNTHDKELVWTSSDPAVATVDAFGIVTVRKAGRVHIYATAKSGVQDVIELIAIPSEGKTMGLTTECRVPAYRTADISDRCAYLKQGITFVIAGEENGFYKIEFQVGNLDYAYVKKDKIEIITDTAAIIGSITGLVTTTYNASINSGVVAYSADIFDATKTTATQVYLPAGTRVLVCAKLSTDPKGTESYYKISFGDNNMFDNYYVAIPYVTFASFYTTPGVGQTVTYDASTIATIGNNVIVDPGTGAQIATEIEDPALMTRAAVNINSAEVYSGYAPADRVVMGRLYRGTEVTIVSRKHEGYYQIRLDNGTVCWIRYDYLTVIGKPPVTVPTLDVELLKTVKATYLRKSASSKGTKISKLSKSTKLYPMGDSKNGYLKVKTISGTIGWVLASALTDYSITLETESDIQLMATIKSKSKFLKSAKKTGRLVSTLKTGTEVIVLETLKNGFSKVMLINGKTGYVLTSRLNTYEADVQLPSTGNTNVTLHKVNQLKLNVYNLAKEYGSIVVATLTANESVMIEYELTDANGTTWYYIELPDGSHGYVHGIGSLLFK